jgi:hypothetical protein
MAAGRKTGGRRKGSKNKAPSDKRAALERASALAQRDGSGRSMGCIQIDAARYLESLSLAERQRENPDLDRATRYAVMAAKVAHDVSAWLYPTVQAIRHSGDEDGAPLRLEHLSDHQLEALIRRLQRA